MEFKTLRRKFALILLLAGLASSSIAAVQLSKEQGNALERKIDEIAKNGSSHPVQSKKTLISERAVAAYLGSTAKTKFLAV